MNPQILELQKLYQQDRFDEVILRANQILETEPQLIPAKLFLGAAYVGKGLFDRAIPELLEYLKTNPRDAIGQHFLAMSFLQLGEFDRAYDVILTAIALSPSQFDLYQTLSSICLRLDKSQEAENASRKCLSLNPNCDVAYENLAEALYWLQKDQAAIEILEVCVQKKSEPLKAYVLLAAIYKRLNQEKEARFNLEMASKCAADKFDLLVYYASLLNRVNFTEEALATYERCLDVNPNDLRALQNLESFYRTLGKFDQSREICIQLIAKFPEITESYLYFINTKKATAEDDWFPKAIESVLPRTSNQPKNRSNLFYALGKYYDDRKDHEQAASAYEKANDLAAAEIEKFDIEDYRKRVDSLIKLVTPELFLKLKHFGSKSDRPIFVVGMIRSGTTLVEQIISGHPDVFAGGEINYFIKNRDEVVTAIETSNGKQVFEIREGYLQTLERLNSTANRVTDKLPANVMLLGILYILFPNAKFVHCNRNPADTALSIYLTPFSNSVPFSHDRRSIVEVYQEYKKTIDHWRKVLPPESLFEIDYEELIKNQEHVSRRLIDFCGLEWNDQCLQFNQNKEQVFTPSAWQVRQPIYRDSIERWKQYAPWFPEFGTLADISQ